MNENELKSELANDVYQRSSQSAYGHLLLIFIFLGISKNYLNLYKSFVYLTIACVILSIIRIIACNKYLKYKDNFHGTIINLLTIGTGLVWAGLFSAVYLELGLFKGPSLSLFIIIAGIAGAGASSLFGIKKVMVIFLITVLLIPGTLIIVHESNINNKMIGLISFAYLIFLYAQSKISINNLIARIKLAKYLEAEANRVETLFNSVPGIFCYFQLNGKVLASNQGWKDFKNKLSKSENFFEGLESSFLNKINSFIDSNMEKMSTEYQFMQIDSEPIFICNAQKITASNGIIVFLLDISSLKKIQEEMKLKDAHFQHSARLIELGEMLGSIAHEINNPLTVVSGRAQVSKRILKSANIEIPKLINNMDLIETSSHRISKLVNGMKSLVRNSEADPFTDQSFDTHLEIVKFLIANKSEMRKVQFDLQVLTNDLNGYCRPTQVEQVLINLLNNAVDAAELTDEKWVKLIITSDVYHLRFEIIDSGNGISDENLKKIWNPFFTTKDIGKGTGLGLAISHSIILENNGNIYYNKISKNTSFVVEIPKLRQAA